MESLKEIKEMENALKEILKEEGTEAAMRAIWKLGIADEEEDEGRILLDIRIYEELIKVIYFMIKLENYKNFNNKDGESILNFDGTLNTSKDYVLCYVGDLKPPSKLPVETTLTKLLLCASLWGSVFSM